MLPEERSKNVINYLKRRKMRKFINSSLLIIDVFCNSQFSLIVHYVKIMKTNLLGK